MANIISQLLGLEQPQNGAGTPQAMTVWREDTPTTSVMDDLLASVQDVVIRRFRETEFGKQLEAKARQQAINDWFARWGPWFVVGGIGLLLLLLLGRR